MDKSETVKNSKFLEVITRSTFNKDINRGVKGLFGLKDIFGNLQENHLKF